MTLATIITYAGSNADTITISGADAFIATANSANTADFIADMTNANSEAPLGFSLFKDGEGTTMGTGAESVTTVYVRLGIAAAERAPWTGGSNSLTAAVTAGDTVTFS